MPYSNLALDADRENGPAARSFPTGQARGLKAHADAHDCIMVRIRTDLPNRSLWREIAPQWRAPLGSLRRHLTGVVRRRTFADDALSLFIVPPRAQASRRCETQATLGGKALRNTSNARRQAAKLR